jgi:hypothetical protein
VSGQRRELLPDQPGLLRGDPPHQVIAVRKPLRVLCGKLCLADSAHAVQGLDHGLIPGQQPFPHRRQQPISPGKSRIARRDIPPRLPR